MSDNMEFSSESDVHQFEDYFGKVQAAYHESDLLASKDPNGAINKFKLGLINKLLSGINGYIGPTNLPLEGFDKFEEDDLPTNSDVRFVLGQYQSAFERIRGNNIVFHYDKVWYWKIDDETSGLPTAPPKKTKG